jgi:hypothetical protein
MSTGRIELLNLENHAQLRAGEVQGQLPHFVQIVVSEVAAAAAACPLFFTKLPSTGAFYAGAMFGFRPDEPALIDRTDLAGFRPLDLERQGFYVSGEQVAIDPDARRFADPRGEPLFEPDGTPAPMLGRMMRALGQLSQGVSETDAFIAALLSLKLIEPIDISLKFDDGQRLTLDGLYSISLDSLHELEDADALQLFRAGHLQLAYAMVGSLRHIPRLAERRNARLATGL